jgi:hypothetical protein
MRIHVSEPCKQLLSTQYKFEEREDDPELQQKVHKIKTIVIIFKLKCKFLNCSLEVTSPTF